MVKFPIEGDRLIHLNPAHVESVRRHGEVVKSMTEIGMVSGKRHIIYQEARLVIAKLRGAQAVEEIESDKKQSAMDMIAEAVETAISVSKHLKKKD